MKKRKLSDVSIKTKYSRIIFGLLILVILIGVGLFAYINSEQRRLDNEREMLQQKAETVDKLAESLNDVLFRGRGYIAFKSDTELQQLYASLDQLDQDTAAYGLLDLSEEEAEYRDELTSFAAKYRNELLPQVIGLVQSNDEEGILKFSQAGNTDAVNSILAYTQQFKKDTLERVNAITADSIREANLLSVVAFSISAVLLLIFTFLIWRILQILIGPILKLEEASNSLAAGEAVLLGNLDKRDEIGRLYEAFLNMARNIQDKEEELTMQNEELIAQQDELQDQQFRLERSLSEIESMMKALDQSSAVATFSNMGVFTYVNDNFIDYTGYSGAEMLGNTYRLLSIQNLSEEQFREIGRRLSTGGVWSNEVEVKTKGGAVVWMHMSMMPYLNDEGQVYKYILIANNISSLKQVQRELAATLVQTEQTKIMLERSNQLNHDITYTLDKQEFAEKFIAFMNKQYRFDSTMFFFVKDRIFFSKGVPQENLDRYLRSENGNMLYRMQTERSYITKRLASEREQGVAPEGTYAYDYYSSVLNGEGEILAVFAGTRIGHSFSEEETSEIRGLMNRVALAIERLQMYQEIEDARKLNRDIVNNVNEGIQFVQTGGRMLHINKALSQMFDFGERAEGEELPKEEWLEHFLEHSNESQELRQFYGQMLSTETSESGTLKYSLGMDNKRHIDVYAIPVYRREVRFGTLFVHRDITREFELDLMKSELVSTVSHELRTPLSSVLGFTELLLAKTMKPEKQLKYLETIHREAKRLTDLINDFLDLQRMESGTQTYNSERVNLSELVLGVIDQFKMSGTTHHILLADEAQNAEVEIDRDKIVQVLTNLLSNAIKFSPGQNEVNVQLYNEGSRIVVEVQDHGLGIPKEQIGQLFQKFRRVDNSASKRIGGTGLGLAICKEIMDKQKGTIGIESVEGEGTVVRFTLPVEYTEGSRHEDEPQRSGADKELKPEVMIVEDDYSLSLLLSEELKGKGFRVTHHYHPVQAFEQAVKTPFVAIVVDLMLGEELDGWDLIRMLKDDPRTENIPIVISSALDKEDKDLMESVRNYLTKPYPPGELTTALQQIVAARSANGDVLFPE